LQSVIYDKSDFSKCYEKATVAFIKRVGIRLELLSNVHGTYEFFPIIIIYAC